MKRKVLALIITTAVVFTVFLSACGKSKKVKTDDISRGKTLIYAQGADPRGLDPAYVDDGESAKIIANIYEGLVKYKENSTELEPCLAKEWTVSKDGKEYTFKLREGVKFHDGTDFNADAVKYNIERQLPPKVKEDMPYASFTFGEVKKVEKVDDFTIKIILKEPYTPFLANLAMCLAAPICSPDAIEKNKGNINEYPIGTGPFKFMEWKKGEVITLEKNKNYWGDKAKLDKVIFKFTKENSVRASELMTGSIDIMDGVDPNDVGKIKESKMNILNEKGMNINYMAFNCARPPFNDVRLRQAVNYSINKEELVKYLYQGFADVAYTSLPSFIPGFNDKIKSYEYSPDKAKRILKEKGKENLQIKIVTYSNPRPYNPVNGQKLAEAVQNYLSKVGIKANIDVYPWKEYKEKVEQGEGDILFYGWTGDNGDADNFLSLFDSKEIKSSLNSAKYINKKVDQLLAKARKTPNGEERNNIYKEIQNLTNKDAPWFPISYAKDMAAYSPKVKNFKMHPTGVVFLKNVDKDY
ncbi:ABC transporter substrate-binding protein [Clostridium rectalis]|uniref:ABC transporter substrate-binding protein n=1 Tax=Clostridium rectalis TaxID=2040295 RepID=UPI000F63F16C|nr:ABC transporter substrate-binding protein [Clostridium rectalis]